MAAGPVPDPRAVSSRAEFGAALTTVRRHADLSIRDLAKQIDVPPATVGGWCSGRNLPQPGQISKLTSMLDVCGVAPEAVPDWTETVHRLRSGPEPRPASPYPGLEPFGVAEAALFFGRGSETADVLARLAAFRDDPGPSRGLLAVVGPSGSGKSSLLRAGVAAALARRTEPADPWTCVLMTPGSGPDRALTEALSRFGDGTRVLVVDQFEEVFTSVADPAERARFLDRLTALAPSTLVVLGMRADFYADAAREPLLLRALQHAQVLLGPLGASELRHAVLGPADAVGVEVEDGLADLVLADAAPRDSVDAHDVGALPLLSHALLSAWERGSGRTLTIADYRAAGGIDGAVQTTAEEAWGALGGPARLAARSLFLRLVHVGDGVAVTRRRVGSAELRTLPDVGPVVDEFVTRRLLTAGTETLEISHEALLSAWPRLRDWVDADRAGLRMHRIITEAANAWNDAERDETLLLRGGRLEAAVETAANPSLRTELNQLERDFVAAGVAAEQSARATARRRTSRLRRLLAAVAVLALVAAGLAVYSTKARSDADAAERDARQARDDALSRQVAGQARALLPKDPGLAEQLALVSADISPTPEARGVLLDQSSGPTVTRVLGPQGPTPLGLSPDGSLIAVGHADDGSVHLYRTRPGASPTPLGVIPGGGPAAQNFALTFSPDGRTLAVGGQPRTIGLWDVGNPALPASITELEPGFDGAVQSIAFAPDGSRVVAGSAGPAPLVEWDTSRIDAPRMLPAPRGLPEGATVQTVTFSPDGTRLVAGGTAAQLGFVASWPTARAGRIAPVVARETRTRAPVVNAVRFSPDGRTLYSGDTNGDVAVRDAATLRERRARLPGNSGGKVNVLAVSPDGSTLVAGTGGNLVRRWSTATGALTATIGNPGPVTGLAFAPDGVTLLATAADGGLRIVNTQGTIPAGGTVFNMGYSDDGRLLAVCSSGDEPGIRLWTMTDPARPRPASPVINPPAAAGINSGTGALRGDGKVVAAGTRTGRVALWDVADPRHPRLLGRPVSLLGGNLVEAVTFSPDGRRLAVAGDDHAVHLLDVSDPARPTELSRVSGGDFMFNAAFSPDGRLLAGANADRYGRVWDISDPTHPRLVARLGGFSNYVYGVAFDPRGRRLAVTSADHTTRLWSIGAGDRMRAVGRPLVGPTDYVYAAAFSPDDRSLAVASNEGAVSIYDVSSSSPSPIPTRVLNAVTGGAFAVAFSPDGHEVVGAGRAGAVFQWNLDTTEYARTLCRAVGDPITRDEWALYVPGAAYDPPCR